MDWSAVVRLRAGMAFFANNAGNVAVMFAIALFPMFAGVGAMVDYTHANSVRAALQAAVDASALIISRDAGSVDNSALQTSANNVVKTQFVTKGSTLSSVKATYEASIAPTLIVEATAILNTDFMRIFGQNQITIGVTSKVKWGDKRLRVALVLDVTGSMASANKMTAMQTASKNLLTQLQNAASRNEDVYVSIIPFNKDVAVDKASYSQSWVRWDLWDEANGSCNRRSYTTQSDCTSNKGRWTPSTHDTWNGCITDRDQNYDTTNAAPASGTAASLFPAEQYGACPAPMMGLTYDWAALKNKIDSLQPNGNTNQAIGLQWGFQSLTAAPFTIPPKDPNYQYQNVIILLSDGLNTQDRWYADQSSIDARQQITCTNVKAAGITVYTVQVNTNGDPTSALLQSCASSSDKFSLLTSASQIVTTFNAIGTELTKLRVAQ